MADLKFGIDNTEEFSLESPSGIEDFLNGNPTLEKIEKKKEEEPVVKDKVTPAKKEKSEPTESKDEEEEDVDPLEIIEDESAEEEPSKKKKEESGEEPEQNQFEAISSQLYDLGIFTQDEDGDPTLATTGEELGTLFQQNAQKQAFRQLDAFLRSRGDDRMDLFDAVFVNGVDPKEYLPVYNQVKNFEGLDMSVETNQEKIFREYYSRLGWDSSKIETKLQKLKDYGDLAEDTEEMHARILAEDQQKLKDQEETAKTKEAQDKALKQQYQSSVQKVIVDALKAKELEGIPVTEALAKKAYDFMVQPKYKLPNGETISEFDKWLLESKKPENIKDRAVLALLKLNNFDFTKIEKKAITKETNALFSNLKKKSVKETTQKVAKADDSFWNNL